MRESVPHKKAAAKNGDCEGWSTSALCCRPDAQIARSSRKPEKNLQRPSDRSLQASRHRLGQDSAIRAGRPDPRHPDAGPQFAGSDSQDHRRSFGSGKSFGRTESSGDWNRELKASQEVGRPETGREAQAEVCTPRSRTTSFASMSRVRLHVLFSPSKIFSGCATSICRGGFNLEVIDIYQQPALAAEGQIIAAPTLIKAMPLPLRRLVGDFSDANRVVLGLDLKGA